jgi:hypothetical protein
MHAGRAVLCILLAGCTSVGTVDKGIAPPKGDEVLFVLGVAPENHRVQVVTGDVEHGLFKPTRWSTKARLYAAPTDGHVVWQGAQSETMAVAMVRIVKEKDDILGRDFRPCGEQRTMVFRAPAGKVVYLGNVVYESSGNRLSVYYGSDFKAAQAFVERNYPQLKEQLTRGKFELLPTSFSCASAGGDMATPTQIQRGR